MSRGLWRAIPGALVLSAAIWALVALIAGCRANPDPPSGLPAAFAGAELVTPADAMPAAPLHRQLRALVGVDESPAVGLVRRVRPAPSSCRPRSRSGLPYLRWTSTPRVGAEWRLELVTTPQRPEPDWPFWLVVSTRAPGAGLPAELTPLGMPGCLLQVNPDMLIASMPVVTAPRPTPSGAGGRGGELAAAPVDPAEPDVDGPRLERAAGRGRALLLWTPPPGSVGQRMWLQLLVAAPGSTQSGFLTSFAIEIQVGNQ